METDIHAQQQHYTVGEDIYGLPGAAFAKKSFMQHTACQSAGEVMGNMFSDGLTYAGARVRKPLQSMSGQGLREEVNEMKSERFASMRVDMMAHGSFSPGLLREKAARCVRQPTISCCVNEVN